MRIQRVLFFCAIVLLHTHVYSQIALSGNITSATASANTVTISNYQVLSGSDQIMIVAVAIQPRDDEVTNSVTYNSVGLTKIQHAVFENGARAELWYLLNPPVTTANVVVTLSASEDQGATVLCFTGVNQTTPFGTAATSANDGATASVTMTSNTGEVALAAVTCNDCTSLNTNSPSVERWDTTFPGANRMGGATRDGGSPTVQISVGISPADEYAIVGISLKPASYNAATQVIIISQ